MGVQVIFIRKRTKEKFAIHVLLTNVYWKGIKKRAWRELANRCNVSVEQVKSDYILSKELTLEANGESFMWLEVRSAKDLSAKLQEMFPALIFDPRGNGSDNQIKVSGPSPVVNRLRGVLKSISSVTV